MTIEFKTLFAISLALGMLVLVSCKSTHKGTLSYQPKDMVVKCYSDSLSDFKGFKYNLYANHKKLISKHVPVTGLFILELKDSLYYKLELHSRKGYLDYAYEFYSDSYDTLKINIERVIEIY